MIADVDAIVVGAGPVGLLAAIELSLAGARVLVLERLPEPSMVTKALGLGPLGAEALQRRGMAAALADAEACRLAALERADAALRERASKFSGHFAGLFIRKGAQAEPQRRMRMVDQQGLEAVLVERADALGIDRRRNCDVTDIRQDRDGVDVAWVTPDGPERRRCAYLIGCDGGRSSVRKLAGFPFPGTPPTLTMYQGIVELDHPERLLPVGWTRTPQGVFSYGAFPGRLFMLDFSGPPEDRQAPVLREEIEAVLRRISGMDVRVTRLENGSRWTDNTRLADSYRQGRILLAGDAAHVHPPFGGQGLSLGLGDAANLGWKLGAVLRGAMPDGLLDSYTAERRPVANAVLDNTLAQAALMRPDPQSGALRDLVARLLESDEVNRLFGEMIGGLATRYDLGSDAAGRQIGDRPLGQGAEAPALYDLMQDGGGVLLDASGTGAAIRLAEGTPGLRCLAIDSGPSMLVRPDACVAWESRDGDMAGLAEALGRWFPPSREQVRRVA